MTNDEKRDQKADDQEQNDVEPMRQVMPDEIVPLDTGEREGEEYLLEEETAVDMMAVSADADAITDRIDSRTEDDGIVEDFEKRQRRAQSGRKRLRDKLDKHHAESPRLTGGDIDAAWDQARSVGDEAVGGTAPTPDQDVVEELGEAVGLTYEDSEPLDIAGKMAERDENRWELNPASAEEETDTGGS